MHVQTNYTRFFEGSDPREDNPSWDMYEFSKFGHRTLVTVWRTRYNHLYQQYNVSCPNYIWWLACAAVSQSRHGLVPVHFSTPNQKCSLYWFKYYTAVTLLVTPAYLPLSQPLNFNSYIGYITLHTVLVCMLWVSRKGGTEGGHASACEPHSVQWYGASNLAMKLCLISTVTCI